MRNTYPPVFIIEKINLFGEFLDTLLFRQSANQKRIFFFCYNISVKTLNHHFLFLGSVNDAIT